MNAKPSTGNPPSAGDGSTLLLKAPEAAKTLAIGERKLWELTNRGDIPCVRIGLPHGCRQQKET